MNLKSFESKIKHSSFNIKRVNFDKPSAHYEITKGYSKVLVAKQTVLNTDWRPLILAIKLEFNNM